MRIRGIAGGALLPLFFCLGGAALAQTAPLAQPNAILEDTGGIRQMALNPDGTFMIAGRFWGAYDVVVPRMARLSPAGGIDEAFVPMPTGGDVLRMAAGATDIFIAGSFTHVRGDPHAYLAKVSLASGAPSDAFNPAPDAPVQALAVDAEGYVYAAGNFGSIGGVTGRKVVKLDPATGAAIASWNPGFATAFDGARFNIAVNGNWLYVSGSVACDPSGTSGRLVRVALANGTVDSSWATPSVETNIGGLELAFDPAGNVFASGTEDPHFCSPHVPAAGLHKFSVADGSVVAAFAPPAGAYVRVAADATGLYANRSNGALESAGLDLFGQVMKLDLANGAQLWAGPNVAGGNGAILATSSAIYVAGDGFVAPSEGLYALDPATGTPTSFVGEVYQYGQGLRVLVAPDGKIYFGGRFREINGLPRSNLARFNADGTLDTSWTAGVDGQVFSLHLRGTSLYVGGYFTSSDGTPRNGAAKFDTDTGALDPTWYPDVAGAPRAMVSNESGLYMAGIFGGVGGVARPWLAKVDLTSGALDTTFNPAIDTSHGVGLRALALAGSHLLVGGGAALTLSTLPRSLARVDTTTGAVDASWDTGLLGTVRALVVDGGNLYVGGSFDFVNGVRRRRLAKLDLATGALDMGWNPGTPRAGTVYSLAKTAKYIYAGGADGINMDVSRHSVTDGTIDASFAPTFSEPEGFPIVGLYGAATSNNGNVVYFALDAYGVSGLYKEGLVAFADSANPAVPDFNADRRPDVIWSNVSSGATYVWHMYGPPPTFASDAFIAAIDPAWKVQGIADFNGDGHPDIVWRNTATGSTYVWYMNDATFLSDAFLFSLPPQWVIQGVADFNGDGKPDFLMRNIETGVAFAWYFNDNVAVGDDFLFGIDPSWKVEQVGDINGDGQPDLLFRSMTSGLAFAWYTQLAGGHVSLGASSPPIFSIDPAWEVVQLADWNRDANLDLLFRNRDTGLVFVWYMNGTTLNASDFVVSIDPAWEIVPRR